MAKVLTDVIAWSADDQPSNHLCSAVSGFVLLSPVFLYGGFCLLHVWKRLETNQWRLDHGGSFHRKGSYIHYRFISFILWVEESKLIRAQKLDARNLGAVLITKRVCCSSAKLCIAQLQNFLKNFGAQSESSAFIHSWLFFFSLGIVEPLCAAAPSSLEKHFINKIFYYWDPGCGYMWEPHRS